MRNQFEDYSNTEIQETIDEWIHSQRDRDIMHRRLIDGITHERLAEEFCMSTAQVKRIVAKSTQKIFQHVE